MGQLLTVAEFGVTSDVITVTHYSLLESSHVQLKRIKKSYESNTDLSPVCQCPMNSSMQQHETAVCSNSTVADDMLVCASLCVCPCVTDAAAGRQRRGQ